MIKKIALICFCPVASLAVLQGPARAQFFAQAPAAQQPQEAAPAIPDDMRLILLIRNAVVALNQANTTGNYTVLREMGTPNFQMANSPARLTEIFAALRTRKIDLSPVMVINPKLSSAPGIQDGQVLRLTGFFPTAPEQVQFDLAFQRLGEQWLLAGIAVNVSPGAQASAAPGSQPVQTALDAGSASPGRPGEARPIHIDLGQKPAAPKKPAAVKKPKPAAQKAAEAQTPVATSASAPEAPAPAPSQAGPAGEKPPAKSTEFGAGWNPFGR